MRTPAVRDEPPRIGRHLTPGRAILLALGALLLAFLLASLITGARFAAEMEEIRRRGEPVRVSELVSKVPRGQPNAADLYAKAFAVAPQDIYDTYEDIDQWTPQQVAAAAQLVAAGPDYYALLDEASRADVCAFPVKWDGGFTIYYSYTGGMRDAGEALAIRARVQALHGDREGAAYTCSTLLRLAEHDRQSPMLHDLLAAVSHHSMVTRELSRLLAAGDLSPTACRTLYAQLGTPDWQAAFTRTLQAERANDLAELAQIDRGFLFHGLDDTDIWVPWQMKAVPYVARPWSNADKARHLRMMTRRVEASRKPWPEAGRALQVIDAEMDSASPYSVPITCLIRQRFAHPHSRVARAAAQDGAAQIALALTVYHHDRGVYPASLAELTRAGWHLPLDPFAQKPYHYRREGKGFAVWSIGPDLTDNHATAYDPHLFRQDQPGYDFVFRRPR